MSELSDTEGLSDHLEATEALSAQLELEPRTSGTRGSLLFTCLFGGTLQLVTRD